MSWPKSYNAEDHIFEENVAEANKIEQQHKWSIGNFLSTYYLPPLMES